MKNGIRTSVALATYQGERYLQRQLSSLAEQTLLPDELVVSDDLSSDRTREIVRSFAGTAPFPVKLVVNEQNLGYTKNFAQALSLCSGELIFLCDQDDVWFHEKMETVVCLAAADEHVQCFLNDAMLTDDALNSLNLTKLEQIRSAGLSEKEMVMGCCMAIRRELLDIALPIPSDAKAHDNWLAGLADALLLTRRGNEVLQYYRRHGSNTSDFFVNSPLQPAWRKKLAQAAGRLPRRLFSGTSLVRELAVAKSLHGRLLERQEQCRTLAGDERMEFILEETRFRLHALSSRMKLRQQSMIRRLLPAWRLWQEGGYAVSGGRAGMIKDLLFRKSANPS
jgi:glycosyltransferase involved in cell wall biosynthesis